MAKFEPKVILAFLFILLIAGLTGCAGMYNDAQKSGGYITQHSADYVVIVYSGNTIMDVYKLHDQFVQSESQSDGINFIDNDGNVRIIAGPSTVIRIKDGSLDEYTEYHAIDEKYRNKIGR